MGDGNRIRAGELADRFWERLLELEPLIGTEVGDDRYDDRLPDPSESGRAARADLMTWALESIETLDRPALETGIRTTLDVAEAIARRVLAGLEHRTDRLGAVSHLYGPGNLLANIASLQRADTPERLERYLARLAAVPAYLEATGEVAREGLSVGEVAPALVVDRTIAQVERLVALDPADSPAMLPLADGTPEDRDRVADVLRDRVMPAYERYLELVRDYRPSATDTIGLLALPNGAGIYAAEILGWTSLELDPERVHRMGREDLERIQEERREAAERLGYRDAATAVAEYRASGKIPISSREDMLRLAEEQVQRGWDATPKFFRRIPGANCEVRRVEEFREADMPLAYYQPPTADGSRPGIYFVNTFDLDQRPLHQLAATTYHEANPGHHFQTAIEHEIEDRPPLRRFGGILAGSAFIEGWGLYSERLADEMGLYLDEYERMGMLEAQAWRAGRLVVDTGIHALGWDRERSVRLLIDTGIGPVDAEIETDRYITMPGQALSYKIGQFEIERWRAAAAQRDGARFSLPAFHDRMLELGSLPLPALQREMGEGSPGG